jgi:hypothetical protein
VTGTAKAFDFRPRSGELLLTIDQSTEQSFAGSPGGFAAQGCSRE